MTAITLRTTDALHDQFLAMAANPVETGAVLLAHLVTLDDSHALLLATELIPVPDEAYEIRTALSLQVISDGYVHALKTASLQGAIALWVHSHPGDRSNPSPSKHDLLVDAQLTDLFADQTGTGQYGYLIVSRDAGVLTFTGKIVGQVTGPITRLSAIGSRWAFRTAYDSATNMDFDLFDRNIRAFGDQIQTTISNLTIAIVGAGGTGSSVAEQLTRLGVRSFILIDPDTLSASNTTRVYGSTPDDVGRAKVDVLGDHLERIANGVVTRRIHGSILTESFARALRRADIVFGCTDDNAGRLRLSRLPYYYLTPVIDCGVQIPSTSDGRISGIFARVTTLHIGAACLICRGRIDLALADAEARSIQQQERLEKEGYAPALPGVEPAVVAFTTLAAAFAVGELLERLIGYGEIPTPSELLLLIHDRAIRCNIEEPQSGHYCDAEIRNVGTDRDMYLGMNWIS